MKSATSLPTAEQKGSVEGIHHGLKLSWCWGCLYSDWTSFILSLPTLKWENINYRPTRPLSEEGWEWRETGAATICTLHLSVWEGSLRGCWENPVGDNNIYARPLGKVSTCLGANPSPLCLIASICLLLPPSSECLCLGVSGCGWEAGVWHRQSWSLIMELEDSMTPNSN